ncbi:MAG TPA: zinc ribbon domain-containing protein [Vicinamibacteria bacterium]|jgi:putative FmdB family regulatory protein
MPIYEYACNGCGQRFEKLVRRFAEEVSCPGCLSASVDKQLSVFAVGASGSTSRASSGSACGVPEAGCGAGACGGGACGLPN